MSLSILGSSLGAIVSASYSTFCNLSLLFSLLQFLLTIIFRRQKAHIRNRITLPLLWLLRCSFFALYTPTFVVAIYTIAWSITWVVCGGWCHRRHLQSRGKRPSNGYIHFSTSNFFYFIIKSGYLKRIFLGHSFGTHFGSPCRR